MTAILVWLRSVARLLGAWLVVWGADPDALDERMRRDRQAHVILTRLDLLLDLQVQTRKAIDDSERQIHAGFTALGAWMADTREDKWSGVEEVVATLKSHERALTVAPPSIAAVADVPETFEAAPLTDTQTFLLLDADGHVEHRVSWHRPTVPIAYPYADQTYHRRAVRADGLWEFVR